MAELALSVSPKQTQHDEIGGWRDGAVLQGLEQLQKVQMEVVEALKELHRMKQSYHRVAHMAHVAREKAADAQTRSVAQSEHFCTCTAPLHSTDSFMCAE